VISLVHKRIFALFPAFFVAGCAMVAPNLPANTEEPTGDRYNGRIVWHDLLTTTPAESWKFYGELFGWEFESPGLDLGFGGESSYTLIRHEGRLIGGMVDAQARPVGGTAALIAGPSGAGVAIPTWPLD
jgi:hypothetical protein